MQVCVAGNQPLEVKFSMTPAVFAGSGKTLTHKLYYLNGGPTAVGLATFKAAMDTALTAAWAAAMCVKYLAPTITIRDMTLYVNQPTIFLPGVNAAYVGGVAGDSASPSQCVEYEKLTGLRGKNNRGSLHLPMVAESNTTDDALTNAAYTLYTTLGTALAASITAGGQVFVPQLFSPSLSNQKLGVTGIWMQPITSMLLCRILCNLKRRKPKNIFV